MRLSIASGNLPVRLSIAWGNLPVPVRRLSVAFRRQSSARWRLQWRTDILVEAFSMPKDLIAKSIDDLIAAAIVELPTPSPSLLPSLVIVLKIPQTHE